MQQTASFAIHIVHSVDEYAQFVDAARRQQWAIYTLDLTDVADLGELEQLLIKTFAFPLPTKGFDAAVVFMSDLEWLPDAPGRLLLVHGMDTCPPGVSAMLAGILPQIVDRWRSDTMPYLAVLVSTESRTVIQDALRDTNGWLAQVAHAPAVAPRTGPVPVYVDGELDTVRSRP